MARKHVDYKVSTEGKSNRDAGKVFYIQEMSCARAERWATHLLHIMSRAGMNLTEDQLAGGMQSIADIEPRRRSRTVPSTRRSRSWKS